MIRVSVADEQGRIANIQFSTLESVAQLKARISSHPQVNKNDQFIGLGTDRFMVLHEGKELPQNCIMYHTNVRNNDMLHLKTSSQAHSSPNRNNHNQYKNHPTHLNGQDWGFEPRALSIRQGNPEDYNEILSRNQRYGSPNSILPPIMTQSRSLSARKPGQSAQKKNQYDPTLQEIAQQEAIQKEIKLERMNRQL